jgi:hypothetical protein
MRVGSARTLFAPVKVDLDDIAYAPDSAVAELRKKGVPALFCALFIHIGGRWRRRTRGIEVGVGYVQPFNRAPCIVVVCTECDVGPWCYALSEIPFVSMVRRKAKGAKTPR